MKHTKPEDLFRAEKERALGARDSQHARLLAEAKAAFDKLMAEGQAARKSGRPRKHPLPPLKTSSARAPTPVRPMPAAPEVKVVAPPTAPPVAKPAKPARAEARTTARSSKSAAGAKRTATRAKRAGATPAKPKAKAKASKKR